MGNTFHGGTHSLDYFYKLHLSHLLPLEYTSLPLTRELLEANCKELPSCQSSQSYSGLPGNLSSTSPSTREMLFTSVEVPPTMNPTTDNMERNNTSSPSSLKLS